MLILKIIITAEIWHFSKTFLRKKIFAFFAKKAASKFAVDNTTLQNAMQNIKLQ